MNLIKKNNSNIPFSLHDSRITKMEIDKNHLTLHLDSVFEYKNEEEKFYPACMHFTNIDFEECNAMVFDRSIDEGNFAGVRYRIKEYINKFADTEFEILTETYGGYSTILVGLIWRKGNDPVTGIINIWTMGDIVFKLE